jgi:hypothetical protein
MVDRKDPTGGGAIDGDRRRVLKALGALSVTGLAGCGGDGDGGTDTDTEPDDTETDPGNTPTDTGDTGGSDVTFEISSLSVEPESPIGSGEAVTVTAEITNTGEDSGTKTVEYRIDGDVAAEQEVEIGGFSDTTVTFEGIDTSDLEPGQSYDHGVYTGDDDRTASLEVQELPDLTDPLISFNEEASTTGEVQLTGTISNPYLFGLVDVDVTLEVPEGWEIVEENGTSPGEIEEFDSREASWTLSVPDDASGESQLTATVTYSDGRQDPVERTAEHTMEIIQSISAPFGLNCGGFFDPEAGDGGAAVVDTRTIDGVEFESYLEDEDPNPYVQLTSTHNNSGSNDLGQSIEGVEGEMESVYQTMMWSESSFGFEVIIEPGTYEVTFHLAEIFFTGEDGDPDEPRIYSCSVNGDPVFEEFHPYNDPGPLTARTESTDVEVEGQSLTIELESSQENPMLNGFEIHEA